MEDLTLAYFWSKKPWIWLVFGCVESFRTKFYQIFAKHATLKFFLDYMRVYDVCEYGYTRFPCEYVLFVSLQEYEFFCMRVCFKSSMRVCINKNHASMFWLSFMRVCDQMFHASMYWPYDYASIVFVCEYVPKCFMRVWIFKPCEYVKFSVMRVCLLFICEYVKFCIMRVWRICFSCEYVCYVFICEYVVSLVHASMS